MIPVMILRRRLVSVSYRVLVRIIGRNDIRLVFEELSRLRANGLERDAIVSTVIVRAPLSIGQLV